VWEELPRYFPTIELGTFTVMPNHVHFIITLGKSQPNSIGARTRHGAGTSPALTCPKLGDIVGAYKSLVAIEALKKYKSVGQPLEKIWQRNYYEHIIRDQKDWEMINN